MVMRSSGQRAPLTDSPASSEKPSTLNSVPAAKSKSVAPGSSGQPSCAPLVSSVGSPASASLSASARCRKA